MSYGTGARPSRFALISAYLIVYIIWGSTYLAIRFSVETIPPFFSGGMRFLAAGVILLLIRAIQSGHKTTLEGWKYAFFASILPFVATYGLLTMAEIVVPSSIAALIVALEPLWFCIIGWLFFKGKKPTKLHYLGVMLGFIGVVFLVCGDPETEFSFSSSYSLWVLLIIISTFTWVFGAFISRNPKIHNDPFMSSGMQMLCGGGIMMAIQFTLSAYTGKFPELGAFSARSVYSVGYLVIFGSLIAYTSFLWLMRVEPANRVATHAFVNPIVAVFLGWILGGEKLQINMLIAIPLIITSVVLMIWQPKGLDNN